MNTSSLSKSNVILSLPMKMCAVALASAGAIAFSGCNRAGGPPLPPPPPVSVAMPIVQKVTDYEEFTGHVEAKKTVLVRPRVTGKLLAVYFEEGAEVHEGDKLFLIDPQVYQADYDRAAANLLQAQAHFNRAQSDYERAKSLISTKSISQADYDLAVGNRDEAKAAVSVADAAAKSAKINVDFCTVRADISGRISRQLIDPGNIAMANETALTSIVSLDPMYAYFDVDENTTLRIERIIQKRTAGNSGSKGATADLALADEKDFPHEGTIQFVDNQLDMTTGTLRFRGVFPNADHMLSAGLFARVRVPIGDPHPALLLPEKALLSDQGQKFVYVMDGNTVNYRQVQVGEAHHGMREIASGIGEKDKVVVIGLQRLKDKAEVKATEMTAIAVLTEAAGGTLAQADTLKPSAGPVVTPAAVESTDVRASATRAIYEKDIDKAPQGNNEKKTSTDASPATPSKRTSANLRWGRSLMEAAREAV